MVFIGYNNFKMSSLQWPVESEPPKYKAHPPLSFGLLLRPELSASVLERGPPADNPKVTSSYCFITSDNGCLFQVESFDSFKFNLLSIYGSLKMKDAMKLFCFLLPLSQKVCSVPFA